jgi:DNA-binding NtrC family response regulator
MAKADQVILVVDDEAGLREALSRLFEDEGYSVLCAEGGKEALEKLQQTHIDLILTDMRMPEMSGIELLKKVRETHKDVGVIILTGYGEIESYIEAMSFGAMEYVSKPFKVNELKFIVNKILQETEETEE